MDEAGFEVEAEGESGAGSGDAVGHLPVLMDAVMRLLSPATGERVVDCTLGRGGHAEALLRAVGASGGLTGFDLDGGNLAFARSRLEALTAAGGPAAGAGLRLVHGSFASLATALPEGERVDVLLADLGVASNQIDEPSPATRKTRAPAAAPPPLPAHPLR